MVSFAQEGEEGIAATQEYIRSMLERVAFSAGCDLLRKGDYSTEERIHVYEFCINLLKLPVSEEALQLFTKRIGAATLISNGAGASLSIIRLGD